MFTQRAEKHLTHYFETTTRSLSQTKRAVKNTSKTSGNSPHGKTNELVENLNDLNLAAMYFTISV